MKVCTGCKTNKKNEEFYLLRGKRRPECKKCLISRTSARKYANKQKLIGHVGTECVRCLTEFPFCALDLHHQNPEEKEHNISDILGYSWERIKKEADKCDLLCACCHRIVHEELLVAEKESEKLDSYYAYVSESCEESGQLAFNW